MHNQRNRQKNLTGGPVKKSSTKATRGRGRSRKNSSVNNSAVKKYFLICFTFCQNYLQCFLCIPDVVFLHFISASLVLHFHLKIAQNNVYFSCEICTFPVTEGNKIRHIYSSSKTPARKLTHNTKFEHFYMQKDTSFWNTIVIRDFGPENPQNPTQKDRNFEKMHSLTSAKMPTNKESIYFSEISHFSHHDSNAPINLIQHQPTNHFLGTPSNTFFELRRPIVTYSDSSTLAQDAV